MIYNNETKCWDQIPTVFQSGSVSKYFNYLDAPENADEKTIKKIKALSRKITELENEKMSLIANSIKDSK